MKPRKTVPRAVAASAGLHILSPARSQAEDAQLPGRLQAVGLLAAGVAHDLNNLLGVIRGYCDELSAQQALPEPARTMITEIGNAAIAAKKLACGVLAFSTGPSSQPEIVDLNESIRRMSSILGKMTGDRIAWEQRLGAGLGQIEVQPGQLEQILMNLALNARDAMPQGGRLLVETANTYLDEAYAARHPGVRVGSYVRLSVSDTGCGMDGETQARVFDPFFTTKPRGQGTGLGLSNVAAIVHHAGGHLAVHSRPGWGSTFEIHFLCRPQPAHTRTPGDCLPAPHTAGAILLAEDSSSLRDLTRRMLESAGYAVLDAGTCEEALALAQTLPGPIPLLITDVAMPGMSGYELAQQLTATRPDTTVLFMSGHCEQEKRTLRSSFARQAWLEKPFTREQFVTVVNELLTAEPVRFGPGSIAAAPIELASQA